MIRWCASFLLAGVVLVGCSTPYVPPVVIDGGPAFKGIADLVQPGQDVDVILVHGMCTKGEDWAPEALGAMEQAITAALRNPVTKASLLPAATVDGIEISHHEFPAGAGMVRMHAVRWSPLTAQIKQQLLFDALGRPTDCASDNHCTPIQASLNAALKRGLLNDCLADALIYQGASKKTINSAMVNVLASISRRSAGSGRPLVVVTDSLGSKITFDALVAMLRHADSRDIKREGVQLVSRLQQVFMRANQLPLLGLADQDIGTMRPPGSASTGRAPPLQDALLDLVLEMQKTPGLNRQQKRLHVVAFTDPNDLLSYRLRPSLYPSEDVVITDVLVSNATTWFGLLERPDHAHTRYDINRSVQRMIACGSSGSPNCQ